AVGADGKGGHIAAGDHIAIQPRVRPAADGHGEQFHDRLVFPRSDSDHLAAVRRYAELADGHAVGQRAAQPHRVALTGGAHAVDVEGCVRLRVGAVDGVQAVGTDLEDVEVRQVAVRLHDAA